MYQDLCGFQFVKKICRPKLLNMEKTCDFVIKSALNLIPENVVSRIFFLGIEIVTAKIVYSKN